MKTVSPQEALSKAQQLCAQSEQCTGDIAARLARWGIGEHDSAAIIASLLHDRYINEERFAQAFVKDKLRFNGWGRIKIARGLREKRIDETTVSNALASIEEEEYIAILQKLLAAKRRTTTGKSDYEKGQKLLRFAAMRGFEPSLALKILKLKDCDEDLF